MTYLEPETSGHWLTASKNRSALCRVSTNRIAVSIPTSDSQNLTLTLTILAYKVKLPWYKCFLQQFHVMYSASGTKLYLFKFSKEHLACHLTTAQYIFKSLLEIGAVLVTRGRISFKVTRIHLDSCKDFCENLRVLLHLICVFHIFIYENQLGFLQLC